MQDTFGERGKLTADAVLRKAGKQIFRLFKVIFCTASFHDGLYVMSMDAHVVKQSPSRIRAGNSQKTRYHSD